MTRTARTTTQVQRRLRLSAARSCSGRSRTEIVMEMMTRKMGKESAPRYIPNTSRHGRRWPCTHNTTVGMWTKDRLSTSKRWVSPSVRQLSSAHSTRTLNRASAYAIRYLAQTSIRSEKTRICIIAQSISTTTTLIHIEKNASSNEE